MVDLSRKFDVLVIGGGNAALCAAISARRAGASVLVLEGAPKFYRGGNTRHTRNMRCAHDAATDILTGPYTEHPRSPIVANDANIARPSGRPLRIDGKLYRLAQDCEPTYGNRVVALEIVQLTPTEYREHLIDKALISATGTGWNAAAMHHVDAHGLADGKWIALVDARGVVVKR